MLVATGSSPDSPAVSADNYRGGLLADYKPHSLKLCPLAALPLTIFHPYCLSLGWKAKALRPSILGAAHGWSHLCTMHLRVQGLFPPDRDSLLLMVQKQVLPAFH